VRSPVVGKEGHGTGECQVGVLRPQHRARRRLGTLRQDHRRCPGRAERRRVPRVGEEGHIAGPGILDPDDACDIEVAVTLETTLETGRQVTEFQSVRSIATRDAGCGVRSPWSEIRSPGSHPAPRPAPP
jgi:hypothetical protein